MVLLLLAPLLEQVPLEYCLHSLVDPRRDAHGRLDHDRRQAQAVLGRRAEKEQEPLGVGRLVRLFVTGEATG